MLGTVYNKQDEPVYPVKLQNVVVSQAATFNLFSITSMLKKGWILSGSTNHLTLTKDAIVIDFDIKIATHKGMLFCIKICRKTRMDLVAALTDSTPGVISDSVQVNENPIVSINTPTTKVDSVEVNVNPIVDINPVKASKSKDNNDKIVNIKKGHGMMSHMGENDTRKSLQYLGYQITRGNLPPCESCRVAKAKRRALPQYSSRLPCTFPNQRIWLDNFYYQETKE